MNWAKKIDFLWHRPVLLGALVFCLGILLFAHTVDYPLLVDDAILIPEQTALRNFWAIGEIFGGRYWGDLRPDDILYRPVTIWTLSANYAINEWFGFSGTHPVGYRMANMALNAAAGCALFVWLRCLGFGPTGLLTALLFVVHPIHTEVVTSVVNRSESLAALLGLLFLIFHWRNRTLLSLFCLFMALCSKESAVAFQPLAIWADYLFRNVRNASLYGVLGVLPVMWFVLRSRAIDGVTLYINPLDNPLVSVGWVTRILTALRVQLDYIRLQVFPVGQSSDYSFGHIGMINQVFNGHVVVFIVCALAAGAIAWTFRQRHRIVLFAVVGYGLTAGLTSNILFPIGTIMGERLVYTPSVFLCLGAAYGFMRLPRRWTMGLTAIILVSFSSATEMYSRVWRDAETLYRHQVVTVPNSAKAHYNLGTWALYAGQSDLAIWHLEKSVAIYPEFADAWNNLGTTYGEEAVDRAIASYRQAVLYAPNVPQGHYNLGQALQSVGDLDGAAASYRKAISLAPGYVKPYINLGAILAGRGQLKEAQGLWEKALGLEPDNEAVRQNLQQMRTFRSEK